MDSGDIKLTSIFLSSIDLVENACKVAKLVPCYRTVLLSYQLVLKLTSMIHQVSAEQVCPPVIALLYLSCGPKWSANLTWII